MSFKFHYPIIVYDLETTDDEDKDIIQIGAVALDKELNYLDCFCDTVYTEKTLSDFVVNLTKITQESVNKSEFFRVIGEEFKEWAEKITGKSANGIRLAAWGSYFDAPLLRKHYTKFGIQYPFSGTTICVKSLAILWAALSGCRTDKISVEKCMEYIGEQPIGHYHNALHDADATAKVFRRIVSDLSSGCFIDGKHLRVQYDENNEATT